MFGNLSIVKKMLLACGAVVVIYAAIFVVVTVSLSHLTRDADQVDQETLPYILTIDEMDLSRSDVQQFLTDVSATHDRDGYKDAEESAKRFHNGVEKYKELFRRNNDAQGLKQIETIEQSFDRFYSNGKAMAEVYLNSGIEAGNLLMKGTDGKSGFDKDSETIASQLAEFRKQQVAEAHKTTANTVNNARFTANLMIMGVLAASLMAGLFGVWITRSIMAQMGGEPADVAQVVKRVADGDLTVQVTTRPNDSSSMLYGIKDMVSKLTGIITEVRSTTESVTTASQEIAQGNADLSSRTEQQASSLQETSSNMQELLSAVRRNADNARQAYQLTQGTCDVADQSGKAVELLVATMNSINESSRKIEDIISVIDGIAFQTNILALNAAVEAARAGEQGRGFAVVAGEVRSLAQRSASAAKEIKQLIGGSVEKVSMGTAQVKDAADTISDVVTSVQLVASLMKDISAATAEQSMSIEQVNGAIVHMDEVTQQNSALVEESAAAAEAMREQAEALMRTVSAFKLESARPASYAAKPQVAKQAPLAVQGENNRKLANKAAEEKDEDWKEF